MIVDRPYRVELIWWDSMAFTKAWFNRDELKDEMRSSEKGRHVTIGYMVGQSRNHFFVAASVFYDEDGAITTVGGLASVPRRAVIRQRKLK